jgi:hypothetical protein
VQESRPEGLKGLGGFCPLLPPSLRVAPSLTSPRLHSNLQERLFDQSDAYRVHVCEKSGLIAVANLKKQQFSSQVHKNESSIVQVYMPYACKLLIQELMSMCVVPRLFT